MRLCRDSADGNRSSAGIVSEIKISDYNPFSPTHCQRRKFNFSRHRIIDLGKKLGLDSVEKNKDTRNIIVNSNDEHIGLVVNGISDVVVVREDDIEAVPSNINGVKGKNFKGVLKTEKQLIGILDIDEILKE